MALTSPVRAIGEAAQEQGQVESLVGVCYSEDNLNIWVEGVVTQTLPILSSLKTHLIHPRRERFCSDESRTATIIVGGSHSH